MEKLTGQMIGNVQRAGGMAPHVIQTIRKETGNPEAVFVHLAQNPHLIAEVNKLPALAWATRIGAIAGQLESKRTEAPKPKERTEPPPPTRKVAGLILRCDIASPRPAFDNGIHPH